MPGVVWRDVDLLDEKLGFVFCLGFRSLRFSVGARLGAPKRYIFRWARCRGVKVLDKMLGFVWGDADLLNEKSGIVWLGILNAI